MIKSQFTVAFHQPISVQELYRILATYYGIHNVEVGEGVLVNGLPQDWIVIDNE
jgi:23S rRNA A1618 N6-methylase RlmF